MIHFAPGHALDFIVRLVRKQNPERLAGPIPATGREAALGAASPLRYAAGPLFVVLAACLALSFTLLRGYDFNPSGPIHLGDEFAGERFWSRSTHVEHGIGYDGQFYFYLANDPFLRAEGLESFIDRPAYRYGRVLYPALVWATSLGHFESIPWAMLGVNLLAVLIGTIATADILRSTGVNRWLALGFAGSPAILLGLIADLAEPVALALVAVGLALHLRGRHRAAGLAMAVGTLAREASVLVAIGFVANSARRRAWREVAAYALPLSIPALWHLWVWVRIGALPLAQSPANFGLPLSGVLYRVGVLLGTQSPLLGEPRTESPWVELMLVGVSALLILLGLLKIVWRRDIFTIQLWVQSAAALCTSPLVWIGLGSYARVLGLLYLFYGLVVVTQRRAEGRPVLVPRSD